MAPLLRHPPRHGIRHGAGRRRRAIWVIGLSLIVGCSLFNREGPKTSCADLGGGARDACKDGIVVTCDDGQTLKASVCDDAKVCEASWQRPTRFRCEETEIRKQLTTAFKGQILAMVLDDTHAYVLQSGTGYRVSVLAVPKAGGTPSTLATADQTSEGFARDLFVDQDALYFAVTTRTAGLIYRVPKAGGAADTETINGFALFDGNIFWSTTSHGLRRTPSAGGRSSEIPTDLANATFGRIAVDETGIYVSATADRDTRVVHFPQIGGAAKVMTEPGRALLAMDDANLYVEATAGAVERTPKDGSEPATLALKGRFLAIDSTHVYSAADPTLWRTPKAGGAAEALDNDGRVFDAAASDERAIYWVKTNVGYGPGGLYRLLK